MMKCMISTQSVKTENPLRRISLSMFTEFVLYTDIIGFHIHIVVVLMYVCISDSPGPLQSI